ncbi:hypothetical protein SAMN05216275_14154 [Streptosporangium canum]|uniref:Uncharacterized protein n=1 Tax=Streptosporangium canum TaxID=324952 RepID=A0A1I4DI13_9ACTN|nr:hypothetical protein [Streptosporangium canum]SFK92440.1 hypothetical protein SAMN05216275_14154 [Streptosporangium canum]
MPAEPYLIAGIRTMPEHMTSPPQVLFTAWLLAENIDRTRGSSITVWDEDPIRAEFTLFEQDENGTPIIETLYVSTLPPMSGVAGGDPEYQP